MHVEQYLKWKKYHSPRAAKAYEVWVRRFHAFTNKPVAELTIHDWTNFAESIGHQNFAPKSVQFGLTAIHNYLRYWRDMEVLPRFPLVLAVVPKAVGCPHNAATEDEYHALLRVLRARGDDGLRDLAMIMILHDTGMRVGELVQLEIDQIEEDASAVIRTEKTVQRRRVFWNPETDQVIQRLIVQRVNGKASTDWLFVAGSGSCERQLLSRNVQRMMKRVTRLAKIGRRVTPHSFRHALIHRLAMLGVPDAVIARVVGHSSPLSISHYTQLSRPEFKEIAERQFRAFALAA